MKQYRKNTQVTKRKRGVPKQNLFTPREVKVIKELSLRPEETKQYQYAYGNTINHTITNDYELNYVQIFGSIARGTGPNQVIGNQIRVKGISLDLIVRCDANTTGASRVFGKLALMRCNYQTTPYTTGQLLKAPDASSLASAGYNIHTRPWNTFSGQVVKVYNGIYVNTAKQFITTGEAIYRKKVWIPLNDELIKFQSSSTYEQKGDDLYLVWILSGPPVSTTATNVGMLEFNYNVYYKDA